MSDNFGDNQPRVLDTFDRSIDNVVFQHRVPPLSSEWNLINQIGNSKAQESNKVNYPSGWLTVDEVQDLENDKITESTARSGQVLTSSTYPSNSFKLVCDNPNQYNTKFGACNTAIVNGWPLYVYNSALNNAIDLDPPTADSYRYDFVFLEVWRKLISSGDPLYPFGCVQANPFSDNEVVADFVGTETTKRVQIQYRIRSKRITSSIGSLLDLDDLLETIYPIGGRTNEYQFASYYFRKYGPQDVGLYVSGSGGSGDQTLLNTVDGFCYAIPMFLVYRRQLHAFDNTALGMHGSAYVQQDQLNGIVSDRPDGKYADIVYKDDIVDLRHRVLSSLEEADSIVNKSFRQLISGNLRTTLVKGFTDFIGTKQTFPGGTRILKRDQLNGTNSNIGSGVNISDPFKLRRYCNASISQSDDILVISVNTYSSGVWAAGVYTISSTIPNINTINGYYTNSLGKITTGVVYSSGILTISVGSPLIGSNEDLKIQVNVQYTAGNNGFHDVPSNFVEYNKSANIPFPLESDPLYLRQNSSGGNITYTTTQTIQGITIKTATDGTTSLDNVRYLGASFGDTPDFGTILSLHVIVTSSSPFPYSPSFLNNQLYGYYILGVRAVYTTSAGIFVPTTYTDIFRSSLETSTSYTIQGIDPQSASAIVKIEFYVGSRPNTYATSTPPNTEEYYPVDSTKFFDTSKQARGITDIHEMIEAVGIRIPATNIFIVDTVDKPILRVGSTLSQTSDIIDSFSGNYYKTIPYVWAFDPSDINYPNPVIYTNITIGGLSDINSKLPCLLDNTYFVTVPSSILPTSLLIVDVPDIIQGDIIKVPLYVNSYVLSSETPYNFYYGTEPYMGLLKYPDNANQITGKIESEGPALITSEGSGSITNVFYNIGKASFTNGIRRVDPVTFNGAPDWSNYLNTSSYNYYIRSIDSDIYYKIDHVNTYGHIVLNSPFIETTETSIYEIVRWNASISNVSNIIDRLPTFDTISDYLGDCEQIDSSSFVYNTTIAETHPVSKLQDPLDTIPFDFYLGKDSAARGLSDFIMTLGGNDSFNLSYPSPHIIYISTSDSGYKKVYQVYLFNNIDSDTTKGKLYLMVLSSSPSGTTTLVYLNSNTNKDTLDLFELIGRPLIK